MISISDELKTLLRTDGINKNIRVSFPNGEYPDFTNPDIVEESVSFTESIFSKDFKFGLCEASTLSFTIRKNINLTGLMIDVSLEVLSNGSVAGAIPYGRFFIKSCKRKANSTERDVEAYTQDLLSDDDESRASDKYYGLSAFEYLKRSTLVNKADYRLNLFASIFSNFAMDPSMYKVDTSKPSPTLTNSSRLTTIYDFDAIGQITTRAKRCAFNVDDDTLYKFKATSMADATPIAWQIVDLFGVTEDKRDYLFRQIIHAFKCYASLTVSASTNRNEVLMFDDRPIIQPQLNLTSTDKMIANANNYSLELPTSIEVTVFGGATATFNLPAPSIVPITRAVQEMTGNTLPVVYEYSFDFPRTQVIGTSFYNFPSYGNTIKVADKDVKVRDILESMLELDGQIGVASRGGGVAFKSFTNRIDELEPAADLTPSNSLVPLATSTGSGSLEVIRQSFYSSLWYADEDSLPFGKVICKCKPDGGTVEVIISADVIENVDSKLDAYKVYDISNNVLVRDFPVTTAEVQRYCEQVASHLVGFVYRPIELEQMGAPWIEAGDWVDYITNDEDTPSIHTIVARHTISGVQNLVGSITAEG